MFHMGGEQELAQRGFYTDITNSGRSSLRLIIESAKLQGKRVLLPDFLCEIIIDIFQEYQIELEFYRVDKNFQYQLPADLKSYDAIYLIKYFGANSASFLEAISIVKECIIIDDVFSPFPQTLDGQDSWYSFNSLRKISPVADYSMVCSHLALATNNKSNLDKFASLKYQAKHLKHLFLQTFQGNEDYVDLFQGAEQLLDSSKGIYCPSAKSVFESSCFFSQIDTEKTIREDNYKLIKSLLPQFTLNIRSNFYSFAILILENRDSIRSRLAEKNIFLPIHWPASKHIKNNLSEHILSIPLDSRYDNKDLTQLCKYIHQFSE